MVKTIIIGAGLSGLYSAFLLSHRNREFLVLEARNRIGGRVLGLEHEGLVCDMGPSWLWPDIHPKITGLINVFGLSAYKQYENGLGRIQSIAVRSILLEDLIMSRFVGGFPEV